MTDLTKNEEAAYEALKRIVFFLSEDEEAEDDISYEQIAYHAGLKDGGVVTRAIESLMEKGYVSVRSKSGTKNKIIKILK